MRIIRYAILGTVAAALTAACTNSPTSPTASLPIAPSGISATAASSPADSYQKITLYFFTDDDAAGGNVHLVGLPVHVVAHDSGSTFTLNTNRQGSVSFKTLRTDTSLTVTTSTWNGYCSITEQLLLPLRGKEGWLSVNHDCAP